MGKGTQATPRTLMAQTGRQEDRALVRIGQTKTLIVFRCMDGGSACFGGKVDCQKEQGDIGHSKY